MPRGKYPRRSAAERFWPKVQVAEGCWLWQAYLTPDGYGTFYLDGKLTTAHRAAYVLFVGPVAAGLHVDHICENPPCVRPDHLQPLTNGQNNAKGVSPSALNAVKTHCKRGHEFTPENTRVLHGKRGIWRDCRICRQWHNRKKAAQAA